MIRLYADVHVERAIVRGLRARGVDVLTAEEDGARRLSDAELFERATSLGRVVFTRDRDFFRESALRQRGGRPFAGVIFAAQKRFSVGDCIRELELAAIAGEPADFADQLHTLPF